MFLSVLSSKEKILFRVLIGLWLVSVLIFWIWWVNSSHLGTRVGFVSTSVVLAWTMLLPGYCFYYIQRMRKPVKKILPRSIKVAIIVTKAPSEPLELIQKTLSAALLQKYPHDTWVADEDPSPEALKWYAKNNIKVSCRKNVSDYHNLTWPRRTRCKEGNLAYFYDNFGYKKYDLVVQLDADHVPQEGYLEEMIAPFSDPRVGYVAAPSICDSNKGSSWSARARIQSEAVFHGPIQCGTNDGWSPVCIGSHYAVRTKALKQIGGIGPELAEDYSTTMLMNARGWNGVWAFNANARGEGPNSFEDVIIQDFQWSRSMITLFLTLYPKLWTKFSLKQKTQFTFAQLWYPLSAVVWLISLLLPISALMTGVAPVNVNFVEFISYSAPAYILGIIILNIARLRGYLRPKEVKFFSWENGLFELARWPWVLIACVDAIIAVISKKTRTFRVTSKNKASAVGLSLKILFPYLVVSSLCVSSLVFAKNSAGLTGYYWFVQANAWIYLILTISVIFLHLSENRTKFKIKFFAIHTPQIGWSVALATVLVFTFVAASQGVSPVLSAEKEKEVSTTVEVSDLYPNNSEPESINTEEVSTIIHIVKVGDSLWKISEYYYGSGSEWKRIKTYRDAQAIYVGDILEIK